MKTMREWLVAVASFICIVSTTASVWLGRIYSVRLRNKLAFNCIAYRGVLLVLPLIAFCAVASAAQGEESIGFTSSLGHYSLDFDPEQLGLEYESFGHKDKWTDSKGFMIDISFDLNQDLPGDSHS